jgi:TPR repeat protein
MKTHQRIRLFLVWSLTIVPVRLIAQESTNWQATFEQIRAKAKSGDRQAQFDLGASYFSGSGVTKNDFEAFNWARKAADQGLAVAQFAVGACYYHGYGVSTNAGEAAKYFRKSADKAIPTLNSVSEIATTKEKEFRRIL